VSTEKTALGGLRVLDLANELGVYCGKLLAGLGADVIKVEKPGGDATRNIGPFYGDDFHPEKSLFFAYNNTGKRSITLDLENRDGQAIFRRLAELSDVVIETFPVNYIASLSLDYSNLKTLNPGLVMTSITPFGQTGPYRNWKASSEIIPNAMGSLMNMAGEKTMPPLQMGNYLVGYGASVYATVGTLAVLHNRLFTGQGDHVDISLHECATSWLDMAFGSYQFPPYQIHQRRGSRALWRVPVGVYPCQDGYFEIGGTGRWNLITAWMVDQGIDVGEFLDSKYEAMDGVKLLWEALPQVSELMRQLGAKYTKLELMHEGQRRGIPITIVATVKDAYEDPHLKAREYFVEVEHPVLGRLDYTGAPYRFSESPWKIGGHAPLIGQHNEEIYKELGFTKQDLTILKAEGAI
jgi:benzylsuccinate CoA-transferase BbsE subunit